MPKNRLRIMPLGGAGEVGRNCWVLEYGDDIIVLDMGVMFPESEMLGVDLIVPDPTYLQERKATIHGVLVSHGHEDHIGALPYLLPLLNHPPVYGTKLTLGLIAPKLKEHKLLDRVERREIEPGGKYSIGPFTIEPFHVAHSIPDTVAFGITTPVGLVVYLTDWKFDHTPVDNWPTDVAKMAELGRRKPLVLLTDCVRAESKGVTPSERVIMTAFDSIFAVAQGRIIITTFASNISRVQMVIDVAEAYGRKVVPAGRSMENNVRIAHELGYLRVPDGLLVRPNQMSDYADDEIVVICTGSQGEPMSALARMANRDYPHLQIKEGDTVVVSATPIPGNETSVHKVIDNLYRLGAEVVYGGDSLIHVSGHAAQEELKMALALLRPQFVVPFHGDYRHMAIYRKLALSMGYKPEQVLLPETGTIMEFSQDYGAIVGKGPGGLIYVDGTQIGGDVTNAVLRDRQLLAKDGILMVVVSVDAATGRVVAGPDVVSRGFAHPRQSGDLIEQTRDRLRESLNSMASESGNGSVSSRDVAYLQRKIKDTVSEYLYQRTRRRPMILPVVMEV
ncbi:ribonuclease J [Kallotenue papyrolyticum]|uniref:ribonuclease J n=1 Tax=Kallotenue papyrolyticum TaxID=1325125 RepID=UPI000492CB26|nr:ribonuclease J [Kallotenue papyrolyticum]